MLITPPQLLLVLQVTAVPLKYQVLPAAVLVAPAMPVDSQAMQLQGWEVKLKVIAAAARAGAAAPRVFDWPGHMARGRMWTP